MSLFEWVAEMNNGKVSRLEAYMNQLEFERVILSNFNREDKQQEKEMSVEKIHQVKLTTIELINIFDILCTAVQLNVHDARTARGTIAKILRDILESEKQPSPTYEPTQTDKWDKFFDSVKKMNATYELPVANLPILLPNQAIRTQQFLDIMRKELSEGDDMLFALQGQFAFNEEDRLKALTDLADWYGDMIVYITSEAIRNGIPIMKVLEIIMASNMTKLGEDGKPIKDENDKFQKGPNFIPPEQKIKELLKQRM